MLSNLNASNPLPEPQLQLAARLVASLARTGGGLTAAAGQLCLLDEGGVLRKPSHLYYVESGVAGWLGREAVPAGVYAVHESVSEEHAKALGVPSLRQLHQV